MNIDFYLVYSTVCMLMFCIGHYCGDKSAYWYWADHTKYKKAVYYKGKFYIVIEKHEFATKYNVN